MDSPFSERSLLCKQSRFAIRDPNKTYGNALNVNLSLTKQRNREINMSNEKFKKKIDAVMTKSRCPESPFIRPVGKSSVAINQTRRTREIMRENEKMAIRIKNAKSTIKYNK